MDKLTTMFDLQLKLQQRLGTPLVGHEFRKTGRGFVNGLTHQEKADLTKWHKEFALALMMEASELMDWSAWKHWSQKLGNKQDVAPFSAAHVREVSLEIVDSFHFLINMALLYGITPDELFELFVSKNAVNHERQESGSY